MTPAPEGGTPKDDPQRRRKVGDLPVGTRILGVVLLTAILGAVGSAVAAIEFSALKSKADSIYDRGLVPITYLGELRQGVMEARLALANLASSTTDEQKQKFGDKLTAAKVAVEDFENKYAPVAEDPAKFEEYRKVWDDYSVIRDEQLVPALAKGDTATYASVRDSQALPLAGQSVALLQELFDAEEGTAAELNTAAAELAARAQLIVVALSLLAVLLGVTLGWLVARGIRRPLQQVAGVLDAVARGDLTERAAIDSRDEIGQMASSLRRAQDSLVDTVSAMGRAADRLEVVSRELDGAAGSLADGIGTSTAEAGSLAATAGLLSGNVTAISAAAEEMHAAISEVSRNAGEASSVASDAALRSTGAGAVIARLDVASLEAANIVRTIAGIAEQTKLLALNATIEAARAGTAGRGFAVVAEEVKQLADSASVAAEEVAARIGSIRAEAESAVAAIASVSEVVSRIEDTQVTIAGAVEEQSATTAEVARTVHEASLSTQDVHAAASRVASVAERSAAEVEQTRATARELSAVSNELAVSVGYFTVR